MNGYSDSIVNAMLSWLKGFASWVLKLFDLAGSYSFSPLEWLSNNWLKLLILFIIAGIVIDILVWLVRWRPYWIWFRKKRVLIDDDNFFVGEELADLGMYDKNIFGSAAIAANIPNTSHHGDRQYKKRKKRAHSLFIDKMPVSDAHSDVVPSTVVKRNPYSEKQPGSMSRTEQAKSLRSEKEKSHGSKDTLQFDSINQTGSDDTIVAKRSRFGLITTVNEPSSASSDADTIIAKRSKDGVLNAKVPSRYMADEKTIIATRSNVKAVNVISESNDPKDDTLIAQKTANGHINLHGNDNKSLAKSQRPQRRNLHSKAGSRKRNMANSRRRSNHNRPYHNSSNVPAITDEELFMTGTAHAEFERQTEDEVFNVSNLPKSQTTSSKRRR